MGKNLTERQRRAFKTAVVYDRRYWIQRGMIVKKLGGRCRCGAVSRSTKLMFCPIYKGAPKLHELLGRKATIGEAFRTYTHYYLACSDCWRVPTLDLDQAAASGQLASGQLRLNGLTVAEAIYSDQPASSQSTSSQPPSDQAA